MKRLVYLTDASWRLVFAALFMVVGLTLVSVSGESAAQSAETQEASDLVIHSSSDSSAQQCVEPTDVMRKEHMHLLNHERDKTVLSGIRKQKHSLVGCIDCHVNKDEAGEFIPINAPKQFCQACHSYTSVKIDCFECHATTPDDPIGSAQINVKDANGKEISSNGSGHRELELYAARMSASSSLNGNRGMQGLPVMSFNGLRSGSFNGPGAQSSSLGN